MGTIHVVLAGTGPWMVSPQNLGLIVKIDPFRTFTEKCKKLTFKAFHATLHYNMFQIHASLQACTCTYVHVCVLVSQISILYTKVRGESANKCSI